MSMIRNLVALTAVAGLFGAASAASAQTEINIDLNDFTVTSTGSGGVVTGLDLGTDDDTAVTEIRIDGNPVVEFTSGVEFTGSLTLDGLAVTGGSYTLTGEGGNSFTVSNITGSIVNSGNGFDLALFLTGDGFFSGDTFEGVDVSVFNAAEPLQVSIIGFDFNSDLLDSVGSFDDEASFDFLGTIIPSPTAATAGLGLMGVLALGKRRKA